MEEEEEVEEEEVGILTRVSGIKISTPVICVTRATKTKMTRASSIESSRQCRNIKHQESKDITLCKNSVKKHVRQRQRSPKKIKTSRARYDIYRVRMKMFP